MTLTRRSTLQTLGALGAGTAMAGTVFAAGEHEDDERDADHDQPDDAAEGEDPAATAAVRVAHFSPDAPNVDVYVDNDQVLSDLAYDEVSPYLEIAPGTYAVEVTAAGDPETVAFEGDVTFGRAFYTIAAVGELETGTFRPLVLVDAGAALLRVVHGSPDASAVDIYAAGGETPLVSTLQFGDSSNYLPLPVGSYSLEVRPAGVDPAPDDDYDDETNGEEAATDDGKETTEPEAATDAVATLEVDLEKGMAYSAYAIGYLEPGDRNDRAFSITVTTDGPMADDEPIDEPETEPAEDELEEEPTDEEPADEPTDDIGDCPGDADVDNETVVDDNVTDDNVTDDNITNDNVTDNVTDDNITDNVTDDNVTDDTGC